MFNVFKCLAMILERMQLGRIFRRLGLPFWTLMGIGVSGWLLGSAGDLLKYFIKYWLEGTQKPPQSLEYLPTLIIFFIPFVVVIIIGTWQLIRYQLKKSKLLSSELQSPIGKKVLILLVSNPDSAMYAINYHFCGKESLQQVYLIPSNDNNSNEFGPSSQKIAEEIKKRCQDLQTELQRVFAVEILEGVSPADAQDTFERVNRVFRQTSYEPVDVVADFTGGTKPMSVGMIMACLPSMRELEYVAYNPSERKSYGPYLIDYQHSAFDLIG
jgi:hypothetical protein